MAGIGKVVGGIVGVLMLLSGLLTAAEAAVTTEDIRNEIALQIESIREQQDLAALILDSKLAEIATAHCIEMAAEGVLAVGEPTFVAPADRARAKGVTDFVHRLLVAKEATGAELQSHLQTADSLSVLTDPTMTHVGIGAFVADDGSCWLTIHMVERVITFSPFRFNSWLRAGVPRQQVTVSGHLSGEMVRVRVLFAGQEKVVAESEVDGDGDFTASIHLDKGKGLYRISFDVRRDNVYRQTNIFDYTVR